MTLIKKISTGIATGALALTMAGGLVSPVFANTNPISSSSQKVSETSYLVTAAADSLNIELLDGSKFIDKQGKIYVEDSSGDISELPKELEGFQAEYEIKDKNNVKVIFPGIQNQSQTVFRSGSCENGYLNALGEGAAGGAITGGASGAFAAGIGAVPGAAAGAVTGSIVGVLVHAGNNIIQNGGVC